MIILSSLWTRDLRKLTTLFSGSALGFKLRPGVDLTPCCNRRLMFSHFAKALKRGGSKNNNHSQKSGGNHGCPKHFYQKKNYLPALVENWIKFVKKMDWACYRSHNTRSKYMLEYSSWKPKAISAQSRGRLRPRLSSNCRRLLRTKL